MNRRFTILLVITLLVFIAIAMIVPGDKYDQGSSGAELLLPQLASKVNDVNRVEIIAAGNVTVATMVKSDGHWQLEQMNGYAANWPKLRGLLAGLAQANVADRKTDKPKYYARLGVEDISGEDAASVLVRLFSGGGAPESEPVEILVGHEAQGGTGQFVRLQNNASSVLLDRTLEISSELPDWVDKNIVDINAAEVAEVEIIHPGGDRVFVTKISADQTDFDLVDLPPEREIQSSWAVNSLGSALSLLELESVLRDDSVDWQDAVRMRLLMFSGIEVMVDMVTLGEDHLVRLSASHPASSVVSDVVENVNDNVGADNIDQKAAMDIGNQVTAINQRVEGWAYGITKYKFDVMVKTLEDMLKPLESS